MLPCMSKHHLLVSTFCIDSTHVLHLLPVFLPPHTPKQAGHVGKVVVRSPQLPAVEACYPGAVVITGGLGSLGLLTASWLLRHGAKRLHLVRCAWRGGCMLG